MTTDAYRKYYASAMRSYNAMETTKRRHFDYLTMLDLKKKKFNLQATPAEVIRLERLLRDHDEEVQEFKARCVALKARNLKAHQVMFEYIAELNKTDAPVAGVVSH